ncbi:MAG: hypothetical protein ABEJ34_02015 [Haloferacaceae archaeon]
MDRISALRNVEEALREFEAGEADLAATERRVVTVLRTYATEFEGEERPDLDAYRARGEDPADGTVVVAGTPAEARDRVRDLVGADDAEFEMETL